MIHPQPRLRHHASDFLQGLRLRRSGDAFGAGVSKTFNVSASLVLHSYGTHMAAHVDDITMAVMLLGNYDCDINL